MAIFKALTFDGVNSLDYGIYITGEAVYNAPERAVEMVNIPGKNGALALDQGRFENIEVTYHAGCFADSQADFADKVMKFRNALASRYTYKRLTDEYHPDEYRLGLYKSGLDVDAVRYGTAGEFNIVFDCKPQRFLTDGDRAISPTEWSDVQTESGELVTIESDGSLAVRSLEVELEPIQDLNGYDKPWAGGAGKNKLPPKTGQAGIAQLILGDDATAIASASGVYLKSGTYTLSVNSTKTSTIYWYDVSSGANEGIGNTLAPRTVTVSEDGYYFPFLYNSSGISSSDVTTFQLEQGSTATAYEPYENICPISGHTECVTSVSGVNVWDEEWEVGGLNASNGALWGTADRIRSKNYIAIKPSTSYYIKYPTSGVAVDYCFYDANQAFISASNIVNSAIITPTNAHYIKFATYAQYGTTYNNDISINYPSTDHEYHAYNGRTYTTSLGRTVYGGTLDVVSGLLTMDRAMVDLGSLTYSRLGSTVFRFQATLAGSKGSGENTKAGNIISDIYKTNSWSQVTNVNGNTGIAIIAMGGTIAIQDNNYADASSFKTAMSGHQLCYELATPQTYQLTSQQIDLLLGTNHLWSDGEITVEYGVHPYYNPTPFDAKPLIKVTGTGTLGIGEYILTITGTASQTLYIDCETMEIYTIEGTVPTGASSLVSINKNDFPVLEPGTNNISVGSGITAVTITPRWWRI